MSAWRLGRGQEQGPRRWLLGIKAQVGEDRRGAGHTVADGRPRPPSRKNPRHRAPKALVGSLTVNVRRLASLGVRDVGLRRGGASLLVLLIVMLLILLTVLL